jgi:glyoxylase-like metal-dependent hydrolase (beta-lactamase superfamily II)
VVKLHYAGGHTSGSSYAYVPEEKVLFAGDLMFAETFPYAGDATCDPEQWKRVFETLLMLDFETLIPGHGPCVGKDEIKKHLRFFRYLRTATQNAIAAGKPYDAIEIPAGFYDVPEEFAWIKEHTLKHWHQFYQRFA